MIDNQLINCCVSMESNLFTRRNVIVVDKVKIFKLTVMTLWVKKSYTN
jgi:hypothetical protein